MGLPFLVEGNSHLYLYIIIFRMHIRNISENMTEEESLTAVIIKFGST